MARISLVASLVQESKVISQKSVDRRAFVASMIATGAGVVLFDKVGFAKEAAKAKDDDVSPLEDLMREHGALNRILLIYEENQRRIRAHLDFQPGSLNQAALMIQKFIEGYHEKLEEEYVFPRLQKAGKYGELCATLELQHKAGRNVTSELISLSTGTPNKEKLSRIDALISSFVRMYRPHEAFEDTVIFPAFKQILERKDYDALGEQFEEREHRELGKEGFEGVLAEISEIEKRLRIYDIKQFTPSAIKS